MDLPGYDQLRLALFSSSLHLRSEIASGMTAWGGMGMVFMPQPPTRRMIRQQKKRWIELAFMA
jgi:hypothetical protein